MTKEQYGKAIARDFLETFMQHTGLTKHDFIPYCTDNVYFITMKLDRGYQANAGSIEPVLSYFRRWYFELSKRSFGKNLGRSSKTFLQPKTYAFIDFPGTRGRSPISGYDMLKAGPAHLHAVMMVMPGEGQKFKRFLEIERRFRPKHVLDVQIEPFRVRDSSGSDLETNFDESLVRLVQYCAKGLDKLPENFSGAADAWTILPPPPIAPLPLTPEQNQDRSQHKSELLQKGLLHLHLKEPARRKFKARPQRQTGIVHHYTAEERRVVEERLKNEGKL